MALPKLIRENLATVVAGVLVAAVLVAACLALVPRGTGAAPLVARIHDGEGTVRELPLERDDTLVVETPLGRNVIEVRDGAARVVEADCPNGDCLRQRPISQPGQQLICLPHQLWVEVVEAGAPDGELSAAAVSPESDGIDLVSR